MNRTEIVQKAFAKYPKARKIAVENVIFGFQNTMEFRLNWEYDCRCYNWNSDTVKAMKWGFAEIQKAEKI